MESIKFYRHAGPKTTYVNADDDRISVMPFFMYELSIDKYTVDGTQRRYENQGSKFVKSNKYIKSKHEIEYFPNKKKMEYCIIKSLCMVGAPKSFIEENYLKEWELKKKSNETRKSSLRKRRVH